MQKKTGYQIYYVELEDRIHRSIINTKKIIIMLCKKAMMNDF
jgi:hypothetical protein